MAKEPTNLNRNALSPKWPRSVVVVVVDVVVVFVVAVAVTVVVVVVVVVLVLLFVGGRGPAWSSRAL